MQRNDYLLPSIFLHERLHLRCPRHPGMLQLLCLASRNPQIRWSIFLDPTLFLGEEIIRSMMFSLLSAQLTAPFLPPRLLCDPDPLMDYRQPQRLHQLATCYPSLPEIAIFSDRTCEWFRQILLIRPWVWPERKPFTSRTLILIYQPCKGISCWLSRMPHLR